MDTNLQKYQAFAALENEVQQMNELQTGVIRIGNT